MDDFMIVVLNEPLYMELKPCVCGDEAEFVYPNDHYTDCYLQCIACGNRTENTSGFYYAYEIPIMETKKRAVELWNNRQYMR